MLGIVLYDLCIKGSKVGLRIANSQQANLTLLHPLHKSIERESVGYWAWSLHNGDRNVDEEHSVS